MILISFLLFSYFNNCFCEKESLIEFSIDNTTIKITNEMEYIKSMTINDNNGATLGHSELINIKYLEKEVDKGIPFSFEIKYNNGDLSSERLQLLFASAKGELIPYEKVKIKYLNYENNIPSDPKFYNIKKRDYSNIEIECSLSQNLKDYKILTFEKGDNINFKKIESYYYFTFGLGNDKKIYKIIYKDNKISHELLSDEDIKDFYIDKNGFLILVGSKIILYSIESDNESNLKINKKYDFLFTDNNSIKKIIYYSSNLYILTSNKLYKLDINNIINLQELSFSNGVISNYEDIIIDDNKIYLIAQYDSKKYLLIYSLFDLTQSISKYPHSKIRKIDIYIHPFNGYKFLGISFEQNSDYSEFFAEFLINNDNDKPIILNKIFTSHQRNFLDFVSYDSFFSYFYDIKNHQIFFIRRGLFNAANFQTINYKFDFVVNKISSIYYNNLKVPFFISDNSYYILSNLSFSNHNMNCTFYKENTYMLRFVQYGDNCQESLFSKEKYSVCQKLIDYNIRVEDINKNDISSILFLIISFYCLLVIMILICLIKETDCFKENPLKLQKSKIKNKDLLYDNDDTFDDDEYEEDAFNIFNYYEKEIKELKQKNIETVTIKIKNKLKDRSKLDSDLSSERRLQNISYRNQNTFKKKYDSPKFETTFSKISKSKNINNISESSSYGKTFHKFSKKK